LFKNFNALTSKGRLPYGRRPFLLPAGAFSITIPDYEGREKSKEGF
jgi:hypothetical protein